MTINPVYKREMTVSSRSIRLALILAAFNFVLAIFAIVLMAVVVEQARQDAQISYGSFLDIFRYVAIIEFALVIIIVPALTSGAISGERERKTLELMLTTKLTPRRIVFGKLEAALSTVIVLIISSLPVLALVFAYGGVTVLNMLALIAAYFAAAYFAAAIGIYSSAICRKSTAAVTIAYLTLLVIIAGTIAAVVLKYNLSGNIGGWFDLLLINPAATFYAIVSSITGNRQIITELAGVLGSSTEIFDQNQWATAGTLIQTVFATVLTTFAVGRIKKKH